MYSERTASCFHEGRLFDAYRYFGAHVRKIRGEYRYTFRVFAPHADACSLVADFTDWDAGVAMARCEADRGVFECRLTSPVPLSGAYKYRLQKGNKSFYKGDPYAFASRGGGDGASLLDAHPFGYSWQDADYRRAAARGRWQEAPINVYEVHLGSFLRREDGGYLSYAELADALVLYAKHMGYTHIELLPITEYPYDGSWGYQVCSYFAPTSRFGTPLDFCRFVDRLHAGGVGVILDWVGAHFPKDEWGLYEFDGARLYEYDTAWKREARSWGTRYFDLGKAEVQSFLISSALFFLREYHIDGLRVDAVASMLYLDYDRRPHEWRPNRHGGNISEEAEEFFKRLTEAVKREFPAALLVAEEASDFGKVTHPREQGGLGFDLKWNMGFSNDLYAYLSAPPAVRVKKHSALTFPIEYAFCERYILPISHDEVVHGKGSFFSKLHGSYEEKLDTFRTALLFFMTFPGKKLLFMGSEFGQVREWNYDGPLDFFLLEDRRHAALREYVAALNRFYLAAPPLYELDFEDEGFRWLMADEADRSLVAYRRFDKAGNSLLAVISFSDKENRNIVLPLYEEGRYRIVFSTYGGGGDYETAGGDNSLSLSLPPHAGILLRRLEDRFIL